MFEFEWDEYWISVLEDTEEDFRFTATNIDGVDCASEFSDKDNYAIFTKYVALQRMTAL